MSEPVDVVLQAAGLHKRYTEGGLDVPVLQGVELTVRRGETLASVNIILVTVLYLLGIVCLIMLLVLTQLVYLKIVLIDSGEIKHVYLIIKPT